MYCRNCGSELPDGSKFCQACGASQAADVQQPVPPAVQRSADSPIDEKAFRKYVTPVVWRNTVIVTCAFAAALFGQLREGVLVFFAFAFFPALAWIMDSRRLKKQISLMQENGSYEAMLREFSSAKSILDDKARYSDNYLFGKRSGHFYAFRDICWIYRYVSKFFMIPYKSNVMIGDKSGKIFPVCKVKASSKAGGEEVVVLARIVNAKNPQALIGHTADNQKEFRKRTS